jgi:hypothetical protein
MANNAATIHTPQIVAPVERHVGFEDNRAWRGFTVTLYRWMLSKVTEYADRPTDIRKQHTKNVQPILPLSQVTDVLILNASKKSAVKKIISLIAKLRMYILGTVRIFLLHVIMMMMMTLPVVPNIKRNIGTESG